MNKGYSMIRSAEQRARCTDKDAWGSPLYCTCGCQSPHPEDPTLNAGYLLSLRLGQETPERDTFALVDTDGAIVGACAPAKGWLFLDGREYLGVDDHLLAHLLQQVREEYDRLTAGDNPGTTPVEAAAIERSFDEIAEAELDARHAGQSGWCNRCHSWCYGDCIA